MLFRSSIDDIIENKLNIHDYKVISYTPSKLDNILGWLTSPIVQSALIMIIFLGIFHELKTPGIGIAGIAALIASILYFSPLFMEGLAEYWEIILFIVGLALIIVEIFAFPGFGIIGLIGIVVMLAGLIFSLVNNVNFSFEEVSIPDFRKSIYTVISGIVLSVIVIIISISRFGKKGMLRRASLTKEEKIEDGYIVVNPNLFNLINKEGISQTILRPSGKIIIDNEYYDAVSLYGYIEQSSKIKVVKFENSQLYVVKI